MKSKILILAIALLLTFVFVSCIASEISWSMKENNPDSLRYVVGLPSVAVGNLSPSARNPGVEVTLHWTLRCAWWLLQLFLYGCAFHQFPYGFQLYCN